MTKGKETSQKLSTLLDKDIEEQMNTELAARDARLQELEARITALEERV